MADTRIDIILPAYNFPDALECGLKYLQECIPGSKYQYSVIVVDDGSTKRDLLEIASKYQCRYVRHEFNKGKGAAILTGFEYAQGDIVVTTDNDVPFIFSDIEKMIDLIALDKYDLVLGSRQNSRLYFEKSTFIRGILSSVLKALCNVIFNFGVIDSQCGLKAYRIDIAKKLFEKTITTRFAFDIEIVYQSMTQNLRLKSMPVRVRTMSGSSIRLLRDGFQLFIDIIKIKLKY